MQTECFFGERRLAIEFGKFLVNVDQILAKTLVNDIERQTANFLPYSVRQHLFSWRRKFGEIVP
jgi:hypothetical protein